jgi:hypothetical protein
MGNFETDKVDNEMIDAIDFMVERVGSIRKIKIHFRYYTNVD